MTGIYVLTLTGTYMTGTKEVKVLFKQMVKNHQEQDQRSESSLQPDGQESPRPRPTVIWDGSYLFNDSMTPVISTSIGQSSSVCSHKSQKIETEKEKEKQTS